MKASNVRKGTYIRHKNQPYLVIDTEFSFYGRGSAHAKLKVRSLDGSSTEQLTFKSGDDLEELEVQSIEMQFLYLDGDSVVFMNPRNYEQASIPTVMLDGQELMLTPDVKVYVQMFNGEAVGIALPPKVKLKVDKAFDATAGNRAKAAKKEVIMETGLKVQAPLFIKEGETLIISTESGEYVGRAN